MSLSAHAAPTFVNGIAIPGATADGFGAGANEGRLGFFSDLYYDPNSGSFWGLSDRGPGGGTISYDTRVQRFTLSVDPATGAIGGFAVAETVKFRSDGSIPGVPAGTLNGLAPSPTSILGTSFDPEGFVVNPLNGNFIVSDEYGPSVYEFTREGILARVYATPANLIPRSEPSDQPNYAGDTGNNAGKRNNRGFEGLAISPDGRYVFAMLQSPMLDEGGLGNGRFARIVKFDTATGQAVAQYAYLLDSSGQGRGISALVALNDQEFLVLERNNRGIGVEAAATPPDKDVYRISLAGATDVSGIALPATGDVAGGVVPVAKQPQFLNLAANTLAELGNKVPEKWEGLTVGPRLANGGYLLLAGTDNDYSVTQNGSNVQFDVYFRFSDTDPYATSIQCPLNATTGCFQTGSNSPATLTSDYRLLPGVLHAYRASESDLAGYLAPVQVPVPGTVGLLGLGLAGLFAIGARRKRATD
jgi:hypothetical protein